MILHKVAIAKHEVDEILEEGFVITETVKYPNREHWQVISVGFRTTIEEAQALKDKWDAYWDRKAE